MYNLNILIIFIILLLLCSIILVNANCINDGNGKNSKNGVNLLVNSNCININGGNSSFDTFNNNFIENNRAAHKLLKTNFKDMYFLDEEKVILDVTSKEQPLPNQWNNNEVADFTWKGVKNDKICSKLFNLHLGQRKLFMAELQALTILFNLYSLSATDKAVVVYAGAASGIHLTLLFKLFPNIEWHLYDPAPFFHILVKISKISDNKNNIHLYNDFFTNETAKFWNNKCDIFICDIRLNADTSEEFEKQVGADMKMQDDWTRLISPKIGASLKFRPPYLTSDIKSYYIKYIKGKVLWQIWPPKSSTECRLIIEAKDAKPNSPPMDFDAVKYQNICNEHNLIDRCWKTYALPCNGLQHVPGYDRCFDCTSEAMAWLEYNKLKNALKKSVPNHMSDLTKVISQPLNNKKSFHGFNTKFPAAIRITKK